MRRAAFASFALLSSCHSSVDHGRPPAHVDPSQPPSDLRRRIDQPPVQQTDREHGFKFLQALRAGGQKAGEGETLLALGGDISAWHLGESDWLPGSDKGSTRWAGVRASVTFLPDRGVTDAAIGPAFGTPLGNLGFAWAYDPQKRWHGGQATAELWPTYVRYTRYGGAEGEGRVEFGFSFPLGSQHLSW